MVSFGAGACFPRGNAGYDIQKYDGTVLHVGHVGCHENIVTAQEACSSDFASCLWSMWLHTLRRLCVDVHGKARPQLGIRVSAIAELLTSTGMTTEWPVSGSAKTATWCYSSWRRCRTDWSTTRYRSSGCWHT